VSNRVLAGWTLLLQLMYAGVAFGWRSWVQRRATGDAGVRLAREAPLVARAATGLMVAGAVTCLAGTAASLRPSHRVSRVRCLGLAGMALGLLGTYRAQVDMGASWRIGVDPAERTSLVTTGLFQWVRNPMFAAACLVAIAGAAAVTTPSTVAGAAMVTLGAELQTRLVEEPYLDAAHGDSYREYASRTGRFVPGVGKPRWAGLGAPLSRR
jgi:protein-S-isoprenylcysteine O-methyltransferase Ste14